MLKSSPNKISFFYTHEPTLALFDSFLIAVSRMDIRMHINGIFELTAALHLFAYFTGRHKCECSQPYVAQSCWH